MNTNNKITTVAVGVSLALTVLVACAKSGDGQKGMTSSNSEAGIVTNENGSVSRTFTERTVTTNGNMVTEHRRETRTTTDTDGNMLATTTSEYAQSYPVGQESMHFATTGGSADTARESVADSFMGLKFGAVFEGTNFVSDAEEPTLLQARFTPKTPLSGFDDYYVYVTPKTHKVTKIFACAKQNVEPSTNWRRHYLIEALEKRYQTWARPRSWCRPIYTFDLGSGRYVTACLEDANRDYGTILAAWDDALLTTAADETEAIRIEARKAAADRRKTRVSEAASAF